MGRIASVVVALLIAASSVARADDFSDEMRLRATVDHLREVAADTVAKGQHYPVIELVTMGVGSLIWERHGHIALCIVDADPREDACYNYGVASFEHPVAMAAGFFRGTHSFWVEKMDPDFMLSIYTSRDRTVWVQPLPLDAAQKKDVIDKLEHDILEPNKYYAYDHFWDNCTTRVRDIIDHATGGALSSMKEQTDGRTYRDLARAGFYGMRVPLIITDIAMGRVTDREPTYWERMFLPDYLREAVQKKWGVEPIAIYTRQGPPAPQSSPSGRLWFALILLLLTTPAWATRLWGRFQRTGLAIALAPQVLLGTVFWVLAIISPLPYVRWNESCLVLIPLDLALLFLNPERRRLYARARVAMLAVIALLLLVGILKQPIWPLLLWPLVPCAVVGLWPAAPVKATEAATASDKPPRRWGAAKKKKPKR
jgi:hypothetical protein